MPTDDTIPAERFALFRRIFAAWALLGGLLLTGVVLVNVLSVVGAALFTLNEQGSLAGLLPSWLASPVPGDFELTEMGVCIAVFAFLPYCQITRSNVTADIFTSRASRRWVARFSLLAALIALGFMALLAWRMFFGMRDQLQYGYTTAILQIEHGYAFIPILISLVFAAIAAALTLAEDAAQV